MSIRTYKPTSASRRNMTNSTFDISIYDGSKSSRMLS